MCWLSYEGRGPGERLGLAREPGQPFGIRREQIGQDLKRDVAVEPRVAGPIDLAHAAFAELVEDPVRTERGSWSETHDAR